MILSCDRNQILPPSSFCTLVFHILTNAGWFTHEISLWMVPFHFSCCHPGPVSHYLKPITPWCYQHPKAGKVNPKDARSLDRDSPAPEKNQSYSVPYNYLGKCHHRLRPNLYSVRRGLQNFLLSFLSSSNKYLLTVCYVTHYNAGATME